MYVAQRESCMGMSWQRQNVLFTPAHTDCFHTAMKYVVVKEKLPVCMALWVVGGLGEHTQLIEDLLSNNVLHEDCGSVSFPSLYHVFLPL